MKNLWNETEWFPPLVVGVGALAGLLAMVWLGAFGIAVVNRAFAADAYRKCVVACGPIGVRYIDPEYKCGCGQPAVDVNLKGRAP
jgi:hypothetical protein